ncbi:MAG: glycosyltransferase family 4 protein [Gammaproteobacteria bacterium]|nr:glycosyltransferase family 4 protein [Gammaproteobacteria bacterium]
MEKLKVTFLYSASGFGGIVRNLGYIVNGLDRQKFEIHVILLTDTEEPGSILSIENPAVSFQSLHTAGRLDFKTIRSLASYLKSNQIDVLSCHGFKADVFGWILRFLFRVPVRLLSIAHGWVTPGAKLQLYYALDKTVMHFFDRIIFVSEQQLIRNRWWFFPKNKVAVVNNAIDCDKFLGASDQRDRARQDHGFKDDQFVLGFVGRLSAEKNVAALIQSLDRLTRKGHDLKALIVGDGPQRSLLQCLAAELGLADAVVFAGYVADTLPLYQAMDAFVSCSRREGLPNSLLESQAVGLPCVVSNIGGHTDVVVDEKTGLLFRLDNDTELDEKIIQLLDNREFRENLGQAGRERVKSQFNLRQRIEKLERLYWQLGSGRAET